MLKPLIGKFVVAATALAAVTAAWAGPAQLLDQSKESKNVELAPPPACDPRWYVSVDGGGDFNVGGTLSNGFTRPFDVLTIIGPFPARVETRDRDWNDAFDDAWRVGGQVGYAMTQHLEVFGSFRYSHAEGVNRTTEHVFVDLSRIGGSTRADFPFVRDWSDYSSWGGELGFRYYFFAREARFRPYLSLSGGASHTDAIDISTRIDLTNFGGPPGFPIFKGGFFDDSLVATGSALLGLEFRLACHWAVGVESGIRYETKLGDNDSDYKGLAAFDTLFAVPLRAFRPSNDDAGDRWSVPVTGYLKFRF